MAITPAAPAPPQYQVDFQHPQVSDLLAGLAVAFVGISLCTIFALLRVYARVAQAKSFSIEDICVVAAWILAIAVQVIFIWLRLTDHIGVHIFELSVSKANLSILMTTIASIVYLPMMAFAKIPLLLFYRRLSTLRWFSIVIWITFATIVLYSLAAIFALVFACTPMQKNWDITVKEGQCIDKGSIYVATASINAATNLILLVLPIPIVMKMKFPKFEKVALASAFGVGLLTFVCSCIELVFLPKLLRSNDMTEAISIPAIWMGLESSLIVICACLPALRRYILIMAPRRVAKPAHLTHAKHSVTDSAESDLVFRHRPVSELTAFNGRIMKKQTWEQKHKRVSSHNVMNMDRYSDPTSLQYPAKAVPASTTQISLDEYPIDDPQYISSGSAAREKV